MGVIADMIRAGVDPDLVERVHVEIVSAMSPSAPVFDEQAERRRAADRARKRLRNSAKSAESAETKESPHTPKENNPSLREGYINNNISRTREVTAAEILETCLSPETARELVAHRKAKRSPLTAGSARALAKKMVAFGDPEGAAAAMMANGWTGFNPDWLRSQSARAGPAKPGGQFRNGLGAIAREMAENHGQGQEIRTVETLCLLPVDDDAGRGPSGADAGLLPRQAVRGYG
jgi:hypothetical protein